MRRFLSISFITLALVTSVISVVPSVTSHGLAFGSQIAHAADNPTQLGSADADASYNGVMVKIMGLFAWLVGVAAITLDNAVYYTVVTMGKYVSNLTAVGVAWRILRDFANIMLIFGFIGAGIATILNVEKYGWSTKMLPMLLVAAVALNFSLFVSEAMVDATNLFATEFYTQINGGNPAGLQDLSFDTIKNAKNNGISSKIMSQLGLQTIYGDALKPNTAIFSGSNQYFIGFMGILLFLVTAFVLFSLAFILIARFVALILLIVFSPVGFMGLAVPQLKYRAGQWWENFLEQIITAPILLLLLYVALAIITDAQFLTGFNAERNTSAWTEWAAPGGIAGFAGLMLSFFVAMGLLIVVVVKAKSMSAVGAGWATKTAGKLTFGATAYGASALLNSGAYGTRRVLQRIAPNSRFTRIASRGLRAAENARMDVRSVPGIRAGLDRAGAGSPIEKSAAGRVRQVGDSLKKSGQESSRQYDQETRIPRLRTAIAANDNATVSGIIGNMSDKELESSPVQKLIASSPVTVATLPQNRFDKLVTSDVLNDAQKDDLRKQRKEGLKTRYNNADAVHILTNEGASQLPDEVLHDPIVYKNLSIRQLNAIFNAGKIKDETATTIGTFLNTDPTFVAYFNGRNRQQQQDLNAFWHTNLSVSGAVAAGGSSTGSGVPPPSGYQQNPGGTIIIPTGAGNGPRP